MSTPTGPSRVARRARLLLRAYPRRWREHHEDEVVSVLLDRAEADGSTSVGWSGALDLVGHGLEERLEAVLRWWPERYRSQVGRAALVAAAALALLTLVAEVLGARARPPAAEIASYGPYFVSGPFMTIGVGLDLCLLTAALLVVLARPGLARALLLAGTAYGLWMLWVAGRVGYPTPPVASTILLAGLALLASLTTLRLDRRRRRELVGYGAVLLGALLAALLLTRPLLGWSVGTMTSSGNVALAALAVALPGVALVAFVVAGLNARRHPGWPAALAVVALPVVGSCTVVSVAVNPVTAGGRSFIPLGYVAVVALVAALRRRAQRTRPGPAAAR